MLWNLIRDGLEQGTEQYPTENDYKAVSDSSFAASTIRIFHLSPDSTLQRMVDSVTLRLVQAIQITTSPSTPMPSRAL